MPELELNTIGLEPVPMVRLLKVGVSLTEISTVFTPLDESIAKSMLLPALNCNVLDAAT